MDELREHAYKFHCRLSKAFMKCLEEEEYMAIRNVLAVGAKIVEHSPAVSRLGAHIMKRVDAVKTKDARGDIKTVAPRRLRRAPRGLSRDQRPRVQPDRVPAERGGAGGQGG